MPRNRKKRQLPSIPCHGSTRGGDNCQKWISPKNKQAYLSGFCGQCTGKPRASPAAAALQDAVEVRQRLLQMSTDSSDNAHRDLPKVTAGLRDAGYSPEQAVDYLLNRVLDGSFDTWSSARSRFGSSTRADVGEQLAVAVDEVAPFGNEEHHLLHVKAFDAVFNSNFRNNSDPPPPPTDVNIKEAHQFATGFLRHVATLGEQGRPLAPVLLSHVFQTIRSPGEALGTGNGITQHLWDSSVHQMLDTFLKSWDNGDLTVDTVDRQSLCDIVNATMRFNSDLDQMNDMMVQVAGVYNDALVAAGQPSLFEPNDEGPYRMPCVGPVVWDGSYDDGDMPNGYLFSRTIGSDWKSAKEWPIPRLQPLLSSDYNPFLDWGHPCSVGRWLSLNHPPQSMLDVGAWHTEHAATVASHPAASEQQRRVASLLLDAAAQPPNSEAQCGRPVLHGKRGRCANKARDFDGWCGRCVQWMENVGDPDSRLKLPKHAGWSSHVHELPPETQEAVTGVLAAQYRRQHLGVDHLAGYVAMAGRDSPDRATGWGDALRDRGAVVNLGKPFARHVNVKGYGSDGMGRAGQFPMLHDQQWNLLRHPDPDSIDDPVWAASEQATHNEYNSVYAGADRYHVAEGVMLDGHAVRCNWGDFTNLMFSDYTEQQPGWWDDPNLTIHVSADDVSQDLPPVQVWGDGHDRPAVYTPLPVDVVSGGYRDSDSRAYLDKAVRPTRAVTASEVAQHQPHPWVLADKGLLNPSTGHVQVPDDTTALRGGGVAVFDTEQLLRLLRDVDDLRGAHRSENTVAHNVLLGGNPDTGAPQVSLCRVQWFPPKDTKEPRGSVLSTIPLQDALLAGAAAPANPAGSPSNEPQQPPVEQSRPVLVPLPLLIAACEQARDERYGSDVVTVAWDDGLPSPGEDTCRPPTVHIDCDARAERSSLGMTTCTRLMPLHGLVWEHDNPNVVEQHLRGENNEDPLDLRLS